MKHTLILASVLFCVSCANQGKPGNSTFKALDKSGDFSLTTKEFVSHLDHPTFAALDADKDGLISKGEWSQPGATKAAASIFQLFDTNKSGTVDLVEFLALKKTPERIGAWGVPYDKDKSGSLSWEELKD